MATTETSSGDPWVKEVQEWYNEEYKDRTGFVEITVDGIVGPGTCKALVRALQMELNLASPDGIFGNQTIAGLSSFLCKFLKKYFGEGILPSLILKYSFELIC